MSDPASFFSAILEGDRDRVRQLLQGEPRLAFTARQTRDHFDERIVHWLYAGDTPLHAAAAAHRPSIVKILLTAGADPNAAPNRRRSRPLHYAADGFPECPSWDAAPQVATLRLLIDAGADLQARNQNGATALHCAVRTRCAAAVECLLDAGADPGNPNNSGSTPFHLAVQNTGRGGSGAETARAAQREIIHAFLARGASPFLRDRNGRTVLQWAKSDELRKLLSRP